MARFVQAEKTPGRVGASACLSPQNMSDLRNFPGEAAAAGAGAEPRRVSSG